VHGRATVKMLDQVLDDILEKEGINENNWRNTSN
jgi:hypothetical protein